MGHIRDLPEKRLSVDIRHGFKPKYDIIKGKEELAEELKSVLQKVKRFFLQPTPTVRRGYFLASCIFARFAT